MSEFLFLHDDNSKLIHHFLGQFLYFCNPLRYILSNVAELTEFLSMNENDGVSIVICCYNSSLRITATLEHLQRITTKDIPWEIILVDNRSDDNTKEKALSTWNINPVTRLKVVTENNRGLINARIKGVQCAAYEIISFIDDDNWIETQWVDKVFSIMQKDKSLAACGGYSEGVFEKSPPEWFSDFSFYYAVGKQQNANGYVIPEKGYLWGAGLTIRKKAWNNLFENGFNNLLKGRTGKSLTAGEDSEICFAFILQGWNLWYDNSLKLKHFIPLSRLNSQYLMKIYEGFGKAEVILSLYIEFISGNSTNKSNWTFQCIAALKKLFISGLNRIVSTDKNKLKKIILWKHDKAYTLELLLNRKKYVRAKKQIILTNRHQRVA